MHMYMRSDDPERSIPIRFNLSGIIPAGSVIQSATLSVWLYQLVDMTSGDWIEVGPCRIRDYRDWVETQADVERVQGHHVLVDPGLREHVMDRYGSPDSYLYFYNTTAVNAYYHWNVKPSVEAWMAGAAEPGLAPEGRWRTTAAATA